ncbi:DUF397 domain-containing protein [Streptomyces sp. adm13(2018)]|uniref:DUF397 domain-containing protein n=1 Tax=Streptomyces sp. adm13(2018) TaxID=2479007 RepID=UPI0011CE468B|nr:DUF397 domain-containing protein [Streptomyces sp. adm13(2018)]TXS04639.1 DUF397 domain-containing protein [Streptomyces sp. adm13(2018)]
MGTNRNLTGAHWRKSSYSSDTGGNCIECAPLGTAAWRKSSYSGDTGGDCIEVADLSAHVAVRDSKNPEGHAFLAAPAAFTAFVAAAAEGRLGGR